jgi:hypothetical protein
MQFVTFSMSAIALVGITLGATPAIATLNQSSPELPKPELSSATPKQSTPYVVVIPGNDGERVRLVRQLLLEAQLPNRRVTIERSSRGVFICAGAFGSRSLAETRVSFLRDNGLDARVAYLRSIRCD